MRREIKEMVEAFDRRSDREQDADRHPDEVRPIGAPLAREIWKMVELDEDSSNRIFEVLGDWSVCLAEYEDQIRELVE